MKFPTDGWTKKARDAFGDLESIAESYRRSEPVLKRYHTGALSRMNTAFRDACYASERRHGGRHNTGGISIEFHGLATLSDDIRNVQAWLKEPLGFYSGGFVAQLSGGRHRRETADSLVLQGVRSVLSDMREWLPVALFVKRLPEPQDAKPVYVPPKASRAAMSQVHRLLVALVDRYRKDVEKAIKKNLHQVVEDFLRCHEGRSPHDFNFTDRFYSYDIVTRCLEARKTSVSGAVLYDWSRPTWKKNGRQWLAEAAKREADTMANTFIEKNLRKLGAIVDQKEKKSKLKRCTETDTRSSAGAFEGTFHLEFRDGSSFDALNMVVYKYSIYGKPFCQYPTTFHRVVWPDGRTAKKQSEKQMNESWAR